MKKLLSGVVILYAFCTQGAEFFSFGSSKNNENAQLQVILGDEKKTELSLLKKEIVTFEEQQKQVQLDIQSLLERTKASLSAVESDLRRYGKGDPFLNKKRSQLQVLVQTLSNVQATWTNSISIEKQHIVFLEDYLKDPEFTLLKNDQKSYFTFDDFQELNASITAQEEKVKLLDAEKKDSATELAVRKKKVLKTEVDYKDVLQKQTDFSVKLSEDKNADEFTNDQQGQLLDVQVLNTRYETMLAENRVKEEEVHRTFTESKYEIESKKLSILRKRQDFFIKVALRIEEKDIDKAQRERDAEYQRYLTTSNHLVQVINESTQTKTELVTQLKELEEQYGISAAAQDWSVKPTTLSGYESIVLVGLKKEQIAAVDRHIELLKAESEIEKAAFTRKDIFLRVIQLWYAIKYSSLETHEDGALQSRRCEEQLAELNQQYAGLEDKRKLITDTLSRNNKDLTSINELLQKVARYHNGSLGIDEEKYKKIVLSLQMARDLIVRQNTEAGRLVERYSETMSILQQPMRQMNTLMNELTRANLWRRSGRAISLEGIKSIIPDFIHFLSDVRSYGIVFMHYFSIGEVKSFIKDLFSYPLDLLFLVLKIIGLYFLYYLMYANLLPVSVMLMGVSRDFVSTYTVSFMLAMFLRFLHARFSTFFWWLFFFFYYVLNPTIDKYLVIVFFLGSTVYLFFLARDFVRFVIQFNIENDEVFFTEHVQARFITGLKWFLYVTVTILPFREAFTLTNYIKSELPDILLIMYSMIVRLLLLSLLRKDDILHFIPTKTVMWLWFWRFVDNYYYPLLGFFIFLMIMIDPYLGGYNNLISYLAWGAIGTAVILKVIYEAYLFLRRMCVYLLFSSDGESLKERFQLSKIIYGVLVVFLFVAFIIVACVLISRLWQKPISWDMVGEFFTRGRLGIKLEDQYQKLSILDVMETFSFIPLGLLMAYVTEKFILHRVFGVLMVSPGVHNAISTITYYLIIILVISFGLWSRGFGFIIAYYLTPLLVAMLYASRDVVGDFLSYFVILIQRPIKVGDFIKIDQEIFGVVRNITPRAVVLRRQQSFVQIVPNARILRDTIYNWDYYLNYIGIPDISVAVGYQCNPDQVKELLLQALETTPGILRIPSPVVRLEEFGSSGYTFLIRAFISPEKTLEQWNIASEVRFSVVRILKAHEIEISAPLRIVKMIEDKR